MQHYRSADVISLWHTMVLCRAEGLGLTCFPPSGEAAALHPLHTSLQLAERTGFTPTVLGMVGPRSPYNTGKFSHQPHPSSLKGGTWQSSSPYRGQCKALGKSRTFSHTNTQQFSHYTDPA